MGYRSSVSEYKVQLAYNADCDGDGVTNYAEATGTDGNPATTADNTDPLVLVA
jgi:hypothetical protein